MLAMIGCRASGSVQPQMDAVLERHLRHANEAYSEGHVDQAVSEYRKAVRRAWAMDDPYASGSAAYNLAACMMSDGRFHEAKDWLLDARVELIRAGASAGNVLLLEAKVAQAELRFDDAYELAQRAACSEPPCPSSEVSLCGGHDNACDGGCVAKIPCLGPKVERRRAEKECEVTYQAQVRLLRARLAAEQYDIPLAQSELASACELAEDACGDDLHAELHDVAALIHIAKGEFLQAGRHLDREAEQLRQAGNYREISEALKLASAAYQQGGLNSTAADRMCRAARILYGRGDIDAAWRYVQLAVPLAEVEASETTQVRLALLANEIAQALEQQGEAAPTTPVAEEEAGMLAPENSPDVLE